VSGEAHTGISPGRANLSPWESRIGSG
jgi:hypothetical protein